MTTDERPPRTCYAAALGGCGGGLSFEHVVSAGILRRLNLDRGLTSTHPRFGTKQVSPRTLGARILCATHNNKLSELDQEALRFFETLDDGFCLVTAKGKKPDVFIDGPLIERWTLKVLAGVVASGDAGDDRSVPHSWLAVLFGHTPPVEHTGLFWLPEPRPLRCKDQGRGVSFSTMVYPGSGVQGIHIDVNSIHLHYFAMPTKTDERAQIHPVRFKLRHATSRARFDVRVRWPVPPKARSTVLVTFENSSIEELIQPPSFVPGRPKTPPPTPQQPGPSRRGR